MSASPWGPGTDVAIESAGITLLKGDLMGIVRARRLSRAVMGNIRQNLFFAFAYNAAGIPIAAGSALPDVRSAAIAHHRGGGDVALLRQRDRQRAPFTHGQPLNCLQDRRTLWDTDDLRV